MPEPEVTAIDELGERHFSFYPAILNVEHNEWVVRELKWSEILIANCRTNQELWIPRRYVGDVATVGDPFTIVGLQKELEYKAGTVWPHERRLLKMPPNVSKTYSAGSEQKPPSMFSRLARGPEMKVGRLVGGVVIISLVAILAVVAFALRPVRFHGVEQYALSLSGEDDYLSVVRKMGTPSEDRWRSNTGELQYRLLRFKDKPYSLILMGADREKARYIGAMNGDWKPVDSVTIPGGGSTLSLLRGLQKF
jgi:hypothetical protein